MLTVDDVVTRLTGTEVHVRSGEERAILTLDAVGPDTVDRAIAAVDARLASGASLTDAIGAVAALRDAPGRCERATTAEGVVVLDDRGATTPGEVRRSLQVVAAIVRDTGTRSIVVAGPLEVEPAAVFEEHDALGRIIVRLDISQLIVIGHGARHLHMAAGLEGSWDGESVLVEDTDGAYAGVRAVVREGDVVLVTGGGRVDLGPLIDRLLDRSAPEVAS